MKASKEFNYYVDGISMQNIKVGDEIPEVAVEYAVKNGFAAQEDKTSVQTKAKKAPVNKSQKPPMNKAQ